MSLNPKINDWSGRSVWLVGASSGIGRAAAELLHAKGARVCVSARSRAPLDAFAAAHRGSQVLPLDATDRAAMHAAAQQVVALQGGIDLVMYCAGTYEAMRADNFDLDVALRHVQVNYVGALYLLDAVLPILRAQAAAGRGGHLSLVSSVAGYRGLPKSLAYGPTKAALTHLAEVLYLDLSPLKLGVSVINPGFVSTPLTAQNDFRMPALITPGGGGAGDRARLGAGQFRDALFEAVHALAQGLATSGLRCLLRGRAQRGGCLSRNAVVAVAADPRLAAIVHFLENLSATDLGRIDTVYTPTARFKDPFNAVQGTAAITEVFAHMFRSLDRPRFVVLDVMHQADRLFLSRDFVFGMRRWRSGEQRIHGASWLQLAADGRISDHRDYWDAAEELYEKLPGLGSLMRWLKRRAVA